MNPALIKVVTYIPEGFLDELFDSVTSSIKKISPCYDRAFSMIPAKSTWRALEGSSPYNGEVDGITVADEIRVEFVVFPEDAKNASDAIRKVHPYEEPIIDLIPLWTV